MWTYFYVRVTKEEDEREDVKDYSAYRRRRGGKHVETFSHCPGKSVAATSSQIRRAPDCVRVLVVVKRK